MIWNQQRALLNPGWLRTPSVRRFSARTSGRIHRPSSFIVQRMGLETGTGEHTLRWRFLWVRLETSFFRVWTCLKWTPSMELHLPVARAGDYLNIFITVTYYLSLTCNLYNLILNLIELKVNIIPAWASKPLSKPQGTVPSNCHTIRILTCLGHTQSHSSITFKCPIAWVHSNQLWQPRSKQGAIAISSIFCQLKLVSVLCFLHSDSAMAPPVARARVSMTKEWLKRLAQWAWPSWGPDGTGMPGWHDIHDIHDDYMTWHRVPVGS